MDRMQLIIGLIQAEEQANAAYIAGNLDRDTWTKELQQVDDRLSVLGVRLGHRPWEGTPQTGNPF
jgi:hypothetical protein